MSGVFISYRREDSSGYAGRLSDILSVHFGGENTFMDVDTIMGGDNFAAVIEEKISLCDVLLAVIGERWLTITAENGSRRLDLEGDFVRREIAKALGRGVRVIPVLVGGATLPHPNDLPEELRPLCARQAMDLRDAQFHGDTERLIVEIKQTVPSLANRPGKTKSNLFVASASLVLVVAAVVGGVLLSRQMKKPTDRANPDSASQRQIAPAARPVLPAQASAVEAHKSTNPAKEPMDVAGKWKATVKYSDEASYVETFNFEVAGTELSGTASFLGESRDVFDGKIEGNRISFVTNSLTGFGDKTYEDKQYYKGTVEGDAIRFSMLIDSSISQTPASHFTAKRSGVK
jgi:hypothetical protein